MMNNEANESVQNSAPTITGIGAGLNPNDPAANDRIQGIMKMRGMDYLQAGVGGAAAGSQAGQGAANPLSAFVQGMAAGLQAPAQIYQQKQAQVKSVIGATPFRITHPEIAKTPGYDILGGLPTDLALEVIKTAASDGIKAHIAGQEARLTEADKFKYDVGLKTFEASLKGKNPAKYEDISAMAKDFRALPEVVNYGLTKTANEMIKQAPNDAAGDLMIMANYARILNPQTRFSESNLDATDISSYIDKYTKGLYDKVTSGKKLQADERMKIKAAALKAFQVRRNEYQNVADVWETKAAEYNIDPDFVVTDKGWEYKTIGGKPVMARQLNNGKWEVKP